MEQEGPSYGHDVDYARTRLEDSVVRDRRGKPFLVREIYTNGEVFGDNARGMGMKSHLDEINTVPFSLGWCNFQDNVSYLVRMPERKWKQGLRQRNMIGKFNGKVPHVLSSPLEKTILKQYPSVDTCMELICNKEVYAMAFSDRFALSKSGNSKMKFSLLHASGKVGEFLIDDNGMNFELEDGYIFLKEELEEVLQNVG